MTDSANAEQPLWSLHTRSLESSEGGIIKLGAKWGMVRENAMHTLRKIQGKVSVFGRLLPLRTRRVLRLPPIVRVVVWLASWWLSLLAFVFLAVGLGLILRFELIGLESARWALSALVQAGAAVAGILFVAISLLWNQANQEREKLRALMKEYMPVFSPDTTAVKDLQRTLSEAHTRALAQSRERVAMDVLDIFGRLLTLVYAASYYLDTEVPSEELYVGSPFEKIVTLEEMNEHFGYEAIPLFRDEFRFFDYLVEFNKRWEALIHDLELENEGLQFDSPWEVLVHLSELVKKSSPHLAEALRRALNEDRVGISLHRLHFFQAFTGRGLKVVSLMWLFCIATGMLILVSIDKIPPTSLSYLVALPVAIGILAIGITLSLGLRAIRSRD